MSRFRPLLCAVPALLSRPAQHQPPRSPRRRHRQASDSSSSSSAEEDSWDMDMPVVFGKRVVGPGGRRVYRAQSNDENGSRGVGGGRWSMAASIGSEGVHNISVETEEEQDSQATVKPVNKGKDKQTTLDAFLDRRPTKGKEKVVVDLTDSPPALRPALAPKAAAANPFQQDHHLTRLTPRLSRRSSSPASRTPPPPSPPSSTRGSTASSNPFQRERAASRLTPSPLVSRRSSVSSTSSSLPSLPSPFRPLSTSGPSRAPSSSPRRKPQPAVSRGATHVAPSVKRDAFPLPKLRSFPQPRLRSPHSPAVTSFGAGNWNPSIDDHSLLLTLPKFSTSGRPRGQDVEVIVCPSPTTGWNHLPAVLEYVVSSATVSDAKSGRRVVGFDMEWTPGLVASDPKGRVATVQVSSLDRVVVVHLSRHPSWKDGLLPKELVALVKDDRVVKCGVGIKSDAQKLHRDFPKSFAGSTVSDGEDDGGGTAMRSALEFSPLARRLDPALKPGGVHKSNGLFALEKLVLWYLGKRLEKGSGVRRSRWGVGSLSREQTEYAACDALACAEVFEALRAFAEKEYEPVVDCLGAEFVVDVVANRREGGGLA